MSAQRLRAPLRAIMKNEWLKLWSRKRWSLAVGMLVLVVGGSFISASTEWQQVRVSQQEIAAMRQQIASLRAQLRQGLPSAVSQQIKQEIASTEQSISSIASAKAPTVRQDLRANLATLSAKGTQASILSQVRLTVAMERYDLAHGIASASPASDSGWQLPGIILSGPGIMLLALLVVFIAGDAVSSERQGGTLPTIFLHADNRATVLLGKALVAVLTAWGMVCVAVIGWFVLGGLLMGFGSPLTPEAVGLRYVMSANPFGGMVLASSHFPLLPQMAFDVWSVLLACLSLGALAALMVGVSSFIRSTSLSTALGALLLLSGLLFRGLAGDSSILLDPAVHMPLMADWTGAIAQQSQVAGATLGVGIAVLIGWAVVAVGAGAARFARLEP